MFLDKEKILFAFTGHRPFHPRLNLSRSIHLSNAEIIFICMQKELLIDPDASNEIVPVDFCDNIQPQLNQLRRKRDEHSINGL